MREIRLSGSEGGGSDPKPGPPTPIVLAGLFRTITSMALN